MNLGEQFHSLNVLSENELKIVMREIDSDQPEEMLYEAK